MIIMSRDKAIFVPQYIRKSYLKEINNPYYEELDEIKNLYYEGRQVTRPSCAEDVIVINQKDEESGSLKDVQGILLTIMKEVTDAWDEAGVSYVLDGGTLLGARREKNKFLFWDDDIDLAILFDQIDKAKQVIRDKFMNRYSIQDYTELAYSPRLSNFRIRDTKNTIVTEKDSLLSEEYKSKGLFLDVYCYSPIIHSRFINKLYRRICIQPLHRKILVNERKYYIEQSDKLKNKYTISKNKYLHRVE